MTRTSFTLALLLVCAPSAGASIIYDNTVTYTGSARPIVRSGQVFADFTIGNEVTAAATDRLITGFDVVVELSGASSGTFQFRVFIVRDTPLSNQGSWDSGFIDRTVQGGSHVELHFDVPYFDVPDRFTWLLKIQRSQPEASELRLPEFDPPAIGSAPYGFWASAELTPYQYYFTQDRPFGVRVTAVAEPPAAPIPTVSNWGVVVIALLLSAAATMALRRGATPPKVARLT